MNEVVDVLEKILSKLEDIDYRLSVIESAQENVYSIDNIYEKLCDIEISIDNID